VSSFDSDVFVFHPGIYYITPRAGSVGGGTEVTIYGRGTSVR